jgi:DNA polymerase-3 subunit alpha (Gram-positive type)
MRLAWYKVYHPLEYYAAYMTVRGEDFDTQAVLAGRGAVQAKIREIKAKEQAREASQKEKGMVPMLQVVNEMMARGIEVLPVDIYVSDARVYSPENGNIRLPFAALEGCGEKAAEQLARAREDGGGAYLSKDEFKKRTGASAPVMALLEEQRAFKGLSESAQMSLFDM